MAGEENYILKVRVASPAALEDLLQEIRAAANVSTRTTIVLSTPYENRPPDVLGSADGSHYRPHASRPAQLSWRRRGPGVRRNR